ncbi:MAG TPA: VWA domain-containing protein [Thermoanaerobaculia bacterium]|nr:VWA domain-containing protein [Thermoanaerobaculia bacterium]
MPRRLIAAVVFLLTAAGVRAEPRGAVDWIFLVDTSASMRGAGGTKNIFPEVKTSLATFIREASAGDSISVLTFDRDVRSHGLRDVHSQLDRDELYAIVDSLEANGNRTHLGLAIAEGLKRSEALLGRNDKTRERAIVLFTDGKEDVRGIATPVSIGENVKRVEISRPWLFFVSLGEHESQLDVFTQRTKILKPQDPNAIREATDYIRRVVQPPPAPTVIRTEPLSLDFGAITPGESTAARELTISSNKPARVSLSLAPLPGITMPEQSGIAVAPNAPARIALQLEIAEDVAPGPRQLAIRIGNKVVVPATLNVVPPPLSPRVAKWIGILLGLLVLALIAAVLYSGKMPGELLVAIGDRNSLEGEIEIVAPRLAPDAAYVGLPNVKVRELALSSVVPLDALAGSDARLFCRRKNGTKQMWIESTSGPLRVNSIELPVSELYDADTIEIGAAKLRFNRVGHERPSAQEDQV